jgi:hypothetical protein
LELDLTQKQNQIQNIFTTEVKADKGKRQGKETKRGRAEEGKRKIQS